MLNASPRCLRLKIQSKIMRETNTAVNRLASSPKVRVTAKPLTGPVRGFAVTLTFGLLANLFTAVFVSRMIFDWILSRKQRGEALSI